VLRYAEVSPNETDPTTSLGELLRSFADGMDRGNWDVLRPRLVNGSLRWREE
jgi:hypothetical protein